MFTAQNKSTPYRSRGIPNKLSRGCSWQHQRENPTGLTSLSRLLPPTPHRTCYKEGNRRVLQPSKFQAQDITIRIAVCWGQSRDPGAAKFSQLWRNHPTFSSWIGCTYPLGSRRAKWRETHPHPQAGGHRGQANSGTASLTGQPVHEPLQEACHPHLQPETAPSRMKPPCPQSHLVQLASQ